MSHRRTCGTMEVHRRLLETDPTYRENRLKIERFTKNYVKRYARFGLRTGVVIIPVVVHVVYNTTAQNISDAQIQSQINVLNEDFRMLNADASSIPSAFQPVAADARIRFQLAVRDPNCDPTTGITRTQTSKTAFSMNNDVKYTAKGGHDAWPKDKYLNLWVCNLGASLLGYAQFPGGPAATDGVVINYTAFGNTGTATAPFDRGRTATHEIGHWLNLLHIWGDDSGGCSGSDEIVDTPNQGSENYNCPSFPHISCNNGPDGDMFMNYMDYTDDACMYMFTAGQSARIDAALNGPRSAILGSDALIPPPPTPTVDLWSQDTPEDLGDEPNTVSPIMWASDDIWVRRQDDGLTNQEHQNPEYRALGAGSDFVYVRIRNRGCAASGSGTIKLYWAKASTALGWPAPWDGSVTSPALMGGLIGGQSTGNVPAGGFAILKFPWYPPNPADYSSFGADKSHFCLLSRIETSSTPPYGITYPEGSDLCANVANNNNIAWKNITIVDEVPEGRIAWITIGGLMKKDSIGKLVLAIPAKKQKTLFDWGKINVDLGKELFKKWADGGKTGAMIEAGEKHQISVARHGAWIGNLRLKAKELHTIGIRFEPHDKKRKGNEVFFLDLVQYSKEGREDRVVGGQRFVVKTTAFTEREHGKRTTLVFDGATWVKRPR